MVDSELPSTKVESSFIFVTFFKYLISQDLISKNQTHQKILAIKAYFSKVEQTKVQPRFKLCTKVCLEIYQTLGRIVLLLFNIAVGRAATRKHTMMGQNVLSGGKHTIGEQKYSKYNIKFRTF